MSFRPPSRGIAAIALLPCSILILFASGVPGIALSYPLNEPGYVEHRMWIDPAYRSPVNLLNDNTSFEVGDASIGALNGGYYSSTTWSTTATEPSGIAKMHQQFTFDYDHKTDGSRSLRIDLTPRMYVGGTAGLSIAWDWFTVPVDAGGNYEISFSAKGYHTGEPGLDLPIYVSLTHLDRIAAVEEPACVYEIPPAGPAGPCNTGHPHAEFYVPCPNDLEAPFQTYTAYTHEPLVAGDSYALLIWAGGAPQWSAVPGTSFWIDAVQVAAYDPQASPRPFSPHTSAEEIFLSLYTAGELGAKPDNIFLEDEAPRIQGDVEICSRTPHDGGRIEWSLYLLGGPGTPVGAGVVDLGTSVISRRHVRASLGKLMSGRLGVYKWIVEYYDPAGLRTERQETSFALVRSPRLFGAGTAGNFGLYLDMAVSSWNGARGDHDVEVRGRYSVDDAFDYARKLGFTRERVFYVFNQESNCLPPPGGCSHDFEFYAKSANERGVTLMPVINTLAPGATLDDWGSWIGELASRYGGDGASPRIVDWNIDNEANMPRHNLDCTQYLASGVVQNEADRIVTAAERLGPDNHVVTTVNDGLCLGGETAGDNFLRALLGATGGPGATPVRDALSGVTVNSYPIYDPALHSYLAPEELDPDMGWGVSRAVRTLRAARQAVQDAPAPHVRQFELSETGLDPGWVQSDRLSVVEVRYAAETMSGDLTAAVDATNKLIRHELVWLSEGATPIYQFVAIAPAQSAWAPVYGLMQRDGMPAATTAAQVELNTELGTAVLVRKIPAEDLATPPGLPAAPETHVVLFQDGDDYVIAGWTTGAPQTVRFTGAFQSCMITSRDMCGNATVVAGGDHFDAGLSASPCYLRIAGYDGDVAALTEGLDLRNPAAPAWHVPIAQEGNEIVANADFLDPGDGLDVQLWYRPAGGTRWTFAGNRDVWADPRRSYTFRFTPDPIPDLPTDYEIMTFAVERTTKDRGDALTATFTFTPGLMRPGVVHDDVPWADGAALQSANPTRTGASYRGTVARPGTLHLDVYDVAGRRVAGVDRTVTTAGPFQILWDGRGAGGARAASGIYVVRLSRDEVELLRNRVVLLH